MGGGDGTTRERKKKEEVEENETVDKTNRVLEWGLNPVRSGCASGGVTTRPATYYRLRNGLWMTFRCAMLSLCSF